LVCDDVVTETRRNGHHLATRWSLAGRHKAPWKWTEPPGLVGVRGTAVRLKIQNALSPLLDEGFIEQTLRRCYQPLLDPAFDAVLAAHYPKGVQFEVGGRTLEPEARRVGETARLALCFSRKRKPSAVGYLVREAALLPEDRRGVAISTFGKVIKHGWDWLGLTPAAGDRVGGVIEAPGLAACLTLNKGDFVRVGTKGAIYLSYRKLIQEAVSRQLEAWGDGGEPVEDTKRRSLRPLERDLGRVLEDLAEEFPLLTSLVEHRSGGQKRLPIGRDEPGSGRAFVAASITTAAGDEPGEAKPAVGMESPAEAMDASAPTEETEPPSGGRVTEPPSADLLVPGGRGRARPVRYGLSIRFEPDPDDPELGRLVESTVIVNDAHPAYRRAVSSRAEGYHIALTVALALARLAVEPVREHEFVTAFLARWGEALGRPATRRR
jgi:hypothetical protein